MYTKKSTLFLAILLTIFTGGCTQSKDYSIYNPKNRYAVGNDNPINYPSDIKLRRAHSTSYFIKKSSELPKPIPSLLPPDSRALDSYIQDDDRLDMPYYERFPKYPMPK